MKLGLTGHDFGSHEGEERIPLGRWIALLVVLVATPVALIVFFYQPQEHRERPAPEFESLQADSAATQPAQVADAKAPTDQPLPRNRQPHRTRQETHGAGSAVAEGDEHPDGLPASMPASQPHETLFADGPETDAVEETPPDHSTSQPAPIPVAEPQWHITLVNSTASEVGPGAVLGDLTGPVMPAPMGQRYAVITVEVSLRGMDRAELAVAAREDREADLRMKVGDKDVPSLGRLSTPADSLRPLDDGPLLIEQSAGPVRVVLVYLIDDSVESAEMTLPTGPAIPVEFPPYEPGPVSGLEGTWRKIVGQHVAMRYANRVIDSMCNAEHDLLDVRRSNEGGWLLAWPFSDVTLSEPAGGDGDAIHATLNRQGHTCEAVLHQAESGKVLVLRLGSPEVACIVYQRSR